MPTVLRVMNEYGDGPYNTQRGHRPSMPYTGGMQPYPGSDFEVFRVRETVASWVEHDRAVNDLVKPYFFAFPDEKAAVQWFGRDGLEKLAKQGYPLVEVEASYVLVSDTGYQCIFAPTRPLDTYADTVRELTALALDRMEHYLPQPKPEPVREYYPVASYELPVYDPPKRKYYSPPVFPDILPTITSVQPMLRPSDLDFVITTADVAESFEAMKDARVTLVKPRDSPVGLDKVTVAIDYIPLTFINTDLSIDADK